VLYDPGDDAQSAARVAAGAEVVIVFAQQWTAEAQDTSLVLPEAQDALISAVARANPHVIVVLETGGPVLMPWLDQVGGVLEAWYPGSGGGEAIARVLFGEVDASGRLPVTFPNSEAQLPRAQLDGVGLPPDQPFSVHYQEGAAVGYKWFDQKGLDPLFAFGFGLSYGQVTYSGLRAALHGNALEVQFDVRNASARSVSDTPQVYVAPPATATAVPKRLAGWQRLALAPHASAHVRIDVDPRLLANWQAQCGWVIAPGQYTVLLAQSARLTRATVPVTVPAARPAQCTNPSSGVVDTHAE
jgi:beta-glucosidase